MAGRTVYRRIAVSGGVYENHLALGGSLRDPVARGAEALFCPGGWVPSGRIRTRPLPCCRNTACAPCGGTMTCPRPRGGATAFGTRPAPQDNHFARLSYQYTIRNTSGAHKARLGTWPCQPRVALEGRQLLMCHRSPRQIGECLGERAPPDGHIANLPRDVAPDAIWCTHTGIQWHRALPAGHRVIVGALGRPQDDGTTRVSYATLATVPDLPGESPPVAFDHEALAREMEAGGLLPEFAETIRSI